MVKVVDRVQSDAALMRSELWEEKCESGGLKWCWSGEKEEEYLYGWLYMVSFFFEVDVSERKRVRLEVLREIDEMSWKLYRMEA